MALSDYLERFRQIAGEGSRAADFVVMKSQRDKAKQQFMNDLNLQKQRMLSFSAFAQPGQGSVGFDNSGGAAPGNFAYPLHGKLRVTSPYGVNRAGHKSAHTGVDWGEPAGTPIYAPADATVRSALFDKIYGNQTILDYGGGRSNMFGHQSKFAVKPGQRVQAGQLIGYVGSTGWSTGPHLHFESWINNKPVNPLSWFM